MTEANLEVMTNEPQVPVDISDEQMDKFFASGGKEGLEPSSAEPEVEAPVEQVPAATEEQPLVEPTQPQIEASEKKERMVDYGALHEERERRKEISAELQEYRERTRKMEEAIQKLVEIQTPGVKEPSFDEDPLEAARLKIERLEQWTKQQQQLAEQQAAYQAQMARQQQFLGKYSQDAQSFMQQAPDFQDAYKHLVNSRLNEYKAAGYDNDMANRLLLEDEMAIAAKAYQDGVNPAMRMYELAKVRGYQKAAAQSTVAPMTAPVNNSAAKIAELEKTIQASKSLGESGGRVDKGLSAEALLEMDDEDFIKNWDKVMKKSA